MPRILIIDDDLDLLKVSKSLLILRGFEVITCTNWEDACNFIQKFNPHLILLDVFLTGIDGLEICKKLKSCADTTHIPVIIVSGYPKVADKVYAYGADAFIAKPFEMNELISNIHDMLSGNFAVA